MTDTPAPIAGLAFTTAEVAITASHLKWVRDTVVRSLERDLTACRAVLRELVAVEDLRLVAMAAGTHEREMSDMLKECVRRKPIALAAARAIDSGASSSVKPLGSHLAMRVLQSDLYQQLDDSERGECDALIHDFQAWLRAPTARAILQSDEGEGK